MRKKFASIGLACIPLAFANGSATAADIQWELDGAQKQGDAYVIQGLSGGDDFPGLKFSVPDSCKGKTLTLTGEIKATGIQGGSKPFHGVHVDYEMIINGRPTWSNPFLVPASPEYRSFKREWTFPANMNTATIRIGPQGVDGVVSVKSIKAEGCITSS